MCPSCSAKRSHIFAETVHADGIPAAIMSLHTAGDLLNFHPHLHAIVLAGVIDESGNYFEIGNIGRELLTEFFAEEVYKIFLNQGLLSGEDIQSMRSWPNSGFSVWIGDGISEDASEQRLFSARYLVRCPLSLERLSILDDEIVSYAAKEDNDENKSESKTFSPLEFIAELSQHIPNTHEQLIRYYGYYSARSRGARRREADYRKLVLNNFEALSDTDVDKNPVSKS